MVRTLGAFLIVGGVLSSASAAAQSGQGSLNGYVKDEQGGILPGATVTAIGPSLLAPVVGVTDNAGYYRLQNLPPGLAQSPKRMTGSCHCLDTYWKGDMQGAANVNVLT